MICDFCGDPLPPPDAPKVTAAAGWCAPSALLYDIDLPRVCGMCMAAEQLGVSRETLDSVTTVRRGGITFGNQKEQP